MAAIQHLMSLENPKNHAITKEMVYKWIVSDQAGKDEITNMNDNKIKKLLIKSIQDFFKDDIYLLKNNLSERAITHRLAVCLENNSSRFHIDCEYNGHAETGHRKIVKMLRADAEKLSKIREKDSDNEIINRYVFPDIIVHKRGPSNPGANVLIVEAKKSTSNVNAKYDLEKLKRYTSSAYENEVVYSLGVFVLFNIHHETPGYELKWFKNGEEITYITIKF